MWEEGGRGETPKAEQGDTVHLTHGQVPRLGTAQPFFSFGHKLLCLRNRNMPLYETVSHLPLGKATSCKILLGGSPRKTG
jgi:hypothetical protein